jgi:deazaflavin-dependent oxidoreductase (nitroreductase family)
MNIQEYNKTIIDEFRTHAGKVGGPFAGATMLLLTTTGAKTGMLRTNPLMYFADNNRYLIIASFAGAPNNPPWYYNLIAAPTVGVEMGTERFSARAEVLQEPERSTQYARIASAYPIFAEYQLKTTRRIPVVALCRQ